MTYSEKLKDPRWQRKRLEILSRDNFSCLICGATEKQLQVHHIVYCRADPWEYNNDMLQTLCVDCHQERQTITDQIINAFRVCLAKIPTKRLQSVAKRIYQEAMEEIAL